MPMGVDIPWLWGQNTMGKGDQNTMGKSVNIPWAGGQIPWVGGTKHHG